MDHATLKDDLAIVRAHLWDIAEKVAATPPAAQALRTATAHIDDAVRHLPAEVEEHDKEDDLCEFAPPGVQR